jgi:hypothetical protein
MSALITLMTPFIDRESLLGALEDEGLARADVVRAGSRSGNLQDITFTRTDTGYRVLVSNQDRSRFGAEWLSRLHGRYRMREERELRERRRSIEEARLRVVESQRAQIHAKAKKLGYSVKEMRENGTVRMLLVKRAY